jgi:hypothetical protein
MSEVRPKYSSYRSAIVDDFIHSMTMQFPDDFLTIALVSRTAARLGIEEPHRTKAPKRLLCLVMQIFNDEFAHGNSTNLLKIIFPTTTFTHHVYTQA